MSPKLFPVPHIEQYSKAILPTERGEFRIIVFLDKRTGSEHTALIKGEIEAREGVLVRIHSECLTSEVFGSLRCDCRAQFDQAMDLMAEFGCGAMLYLRQEGRGIGLGNKIHAYELQQRQGFDTVEANLHLGFAEDLRRYDSAAEMLRILQVRSVDLITNNPLKISGLTNEGICVRRRIPSLTLVNPYNLPYLKTKRDRSGHFIEL